MNLVSDPVHFTNLKRMALSPAHFLASIGDDIDKREYRIGRLTHALILGVQPGVSWDVFDGRRAGKKWEDFRDARPGVDLFTMRELDLCRQMAKAIVTDRVVKELDLLAGETELPIEWTHASGRRCATRGLDILHRERGRVVDIKTAASSHPDRFARDAIRKFAYHGQGSFYRDAARSLSVDVREVFFVAVEKVKPFAVTVHRLTERALTEGDKLCRDWLGMLQRCEEANAWPGYAQCVNEIDFDEDDEDVEIDFGGDDDPAEDEEAA